MEDRQSEKRVRLAALIGEALAVADADGEVIAGCHLAAAFDALTCSEAVRTSRAAAGAGLH